MAQLETIHLALLTLSAAYEHPLAESTILVYAGALADISDEALKQAVAAHLSLNIHFPRIAELRNLALAGEYPDPVEAWGEVVSQIRQIGFYGRPKFSSPLIHRAVEQLGWVILCQSDNLVAERSRFLQAYETLLRREKERNVAFSPGESLRLSTGMQPVQAVLQAHLPSARKQGA
ncbi:MAG: hypothetical protein HUU38_25540 [Anaerolineales bacterium]|nr:hypothetical protein [Anaerolineales bacterium]